MTSASELVALATAPNQLEAELWQGILAEHGILAVLEPGGVHSFLGLTTVPVRLLVRLAQRAEAEQVLAALEVASEDDAESEGS